MKIAVLIWRIGPYHLTRLNAAGMEMDIHAIEACTVDTTYAWEILEGDTQFARHTIQSHDPIGRQEKNAFKCRMFSALDDINPDVLAIPGWSFLDALSALSWSIFRHKPLVLMSDSTAWDERRVWWKEWIKSQIVKLYSSGLVAGMPHVEYLGSLGMPSERIALGYDVVDNRYFEDGAARVRNQKSEIRKKHDLPEKYFIVPARFIWEKNLPRLIEAYAQYRKLSDVPNQHCSDGDYHKDDDNLPSESRHSYTAPWDLVLLGDGTLRPDVCRLIADHGLDNVVHLPGFRQYPELPTYYGLASAMILPSISETWGLVVNEAMACGLPVLVSNRCGCAQDLVQDGVNGYTFDPYDVEQLAQLMHRLTEAPKHRLSEMGDASRAIIADWGPERFADGLKQAVECALEVGPQRASLLQRMILKALLWR
jgi:1,2-diacylglycerol 3-alpha-glucosyltransferase